MKKTQISFLVLAGLLFIALGVYYWVTKAGDLPSFVPGHEAGSTHIHTKHGLAAVILGIGSWVLAWFISGSKESTSDTDK
ncbi:MAG: hypothetical protein JWO96_750 [Candidatus Saccharibacteria bacterium]|nr:hypothetical protein [Candidatus Saccharibacteria bacterium]